MIGSTVFKICYIHIGSPKTGTSSIQRTLYHNSEIASAAGLLYPTVQPIHLCVAAHFLDPERTIPQGISRGMSDAKVRKQTAVQMAKLETQIASSDAETLVLSAEHLNFLSLDGVKRLKTWIDQFAEQSRVVCYVRHPVSQAASRVQQRVKIRALTLDQAMDPLDYYRFGEELPAWVDTFGLDNVIVKPFERSTLKNGDAVDDFLELAGYQGNLDELQRVDTNPSLSAPALMIADHLAQIIPRSKLPKLKTKFLYAIRGPKFSLTKSQIETVLTEAASDLTYLKDTFGIDLPMPSEAAKAGDTQPAPSEVFTEDTIASLAEVLLEFARKETPNKL